MSDTENVKQQNGSKKQAGTHVTGKKWIRNALVVMLGDIAATYFCFFMALLLRFDFSFASIDDEYVKWALYLIPL